MSKIIDARSVDVAKAEAQSAEAGGAMVTAASQSLSRPLPNSRPIAPSRMQFRYSPDLPNRPIAIDTLKIRPAEDLPGQRPIAHSEMQVYKTGFLPGGRPIVPTNKSQATEEMIGYLD